MTKIVLLSMRLDAEQCNNAGKEILQRLQYDRVAGKRNRTGRYDIPENVDQVVAAKVVAFYDHHSQA